MLADKQPFQALIFLFRCLWKLLRKWAISSVISVRRSVCLSATDILAPIGSVFLNFTWNFYQNLYSVFI